ncbi:hypothetical protein [Halopiger djelfimassiliensis]|uniref:hypothetical protein n=1 Tax=Halopiger djelfimassiliensis TaxID=1293047 RepID=UPI0012B5DCF8|nr:hypothetical protein [Halopiger djelfimassiliensis]
MDIVKTIVTLLAAASVVGYECRGCGGFVRDEPTCHECGSQELRPLGPALGI